MMPIRVTKHKQVNDVQHAQTQCYLCSQPLPPKGQLGRRDLLVSEHVIPRSLLGPRPTPDAWPIRLWIHKSCEVGSKRWRDEQNTVLQTLGTTSPEDWRPHDKAFFRAKFGVARHVLKGGEVFHGVSHVRDAIIGAHGWVRGLYMALYGECLQSTVLHLIHPPVTMIDVARTRDLSREVGERERMSNLVLGIVDMCICKDTADRLVAWGGRVRFDCVWMQDTTDGENPWQCFWTLEIPGTSKWSERAHCVARPWHGMLSLPTKPANAAVISGEQCEEFRIQLQKRHELGLSPQLPVPPCSAPRPSPSILIRRLAGTLCGTASMSEGDGRVRRKGSVGISPKSQRSR